MRRKVKHKYGAKRTKRHGVRYDSKLEADVGSILESLKAKGEVLFYLRQVRVDLPGNVRHAVDFLVFLEHDAFFLEAKGRDLAPGKAARAMAEDVLGVEIHVVNKAAEVYEVIKGLS